MSLTTCAGHIAQHDAHNTITVVVLEVGDPPQRIDLAGDVAGRVEHDGAPSTDCAVVRDLTV